uniref:Uncharacterized protein n=1 Tax=Arundo donax TaxID=35708 RepID=A0A0A9GNS4_ARUDO
MKFVILIMIFSNVHFKGSLVQDVSCIMYVSTHHVMYPFALWDIG